MHQLMNALCYSPKVHALCAPSEVHFDWDALFDKIYKRPAAGTVNKNHILLQKGSCYTKQNSIYEHSWPTKYIFSMPWVTQPP